MLLENIGNGGTACFGGVVLGKYIINGRKKLSGTARVHGAKNAVLPIMAATVLSGDMCRIYDCPNLSDVRHTMRILEMLGCSVSLENSVLTINSASLCSSDIPEELMSEMRSSIIFLGALTSAMGRACLSAPGGCELGNRPIDLHIKALREMGMTIKEENGYLLSDASQMHSADIHLSFPSVGATENIILSAVKLSGITTISNAAKEPEIVDLCDFLNAMGADITGAGTPIITIHGRAYLHGTDYKIIPDRIAAATLMCAAMTTKSEIELENVRSDHLDAVVYALRESGARIEFFRERMYIAPPRKILPVSIIKTQVYPGFPTDAQSVAMAYLCGACGTSVIVENLFDSRYKIIPELIKMGADILQDGRVCVVKGTPIHGAHVRAMDLRGGAALTIAALGADGESTVENVHYIERGYDGFHKTLALLGADIKKV